MDNGYISLTLDNKTYQIATMNLTNKINKRGLNTFIKDLRVKLSKYLERQSFNQDEPFGKMVHSGCINLDGLVEHFRVLSSKKGMTNQDIGAGIARYVEEVISIMDQIVTKTKDLYFVNNNFGKLRSNVLKLLNTIFSEEFLITPILVSNKIIDLDHDRLFNNQQNIITLGKIYRETGLFITTKTLLPIIRLQTIYVYNDILPDDEEELITKAEFNENMVEGFTKWLKKLAHEEEKRLEHMPLDEKLKEFGLDKDRLVNIKLNLKDGEEELKEDIHIFMSELDQILFSKVLKPMGKVKPNEDTIMPKPVVPEIPKEPELSPEEEREKILDSMIKLLKEETENTEHPIATLEEPIVEDEVDELVDTPTILPELELGEVTPKPPVTQPEEVIPEPEEPKIYNNITIEAVPSIEKFAQRKTLIELLDFKLNDPNIRLEDFDNILLIKDFLAGKLQFKDPICDFWEMEEDEIVEEEEDIQAFVTMSKKDLELEIQNRIKDEISKIQLKLPYAKEELVRPHTPVQSTPIPSKEEKVEVEQVKEDTPTIIPEMKE